MKKGIDLIAEERQKQINNDNVSGECNDTALEEQFKIWFEKGKCSGIDDVIFHPQKYGLEKQGTPKQVSIWKHWKDGIAGNGEGKPIYLVKIGNTYSLNSCLGFECDYIELSELDNLMLEKQGHTDGIIEKAKTEKQRVIITETDGNANIDWNTRSLEDARKLLECGLQYINAELEKQGEKPADKVESRFKIGDWIVDKSGLAQQVLDFRGGIYTCTYNSFTTDCESNYHLWTIEDAKDGDVLVNGNEIVIFKKSTFNEKDLSGCMFVHCQLRDKNGYWYTIGGINPTNYTPATKEQRDLLFQKMKESGYEWDAEKKELKKIVAPIFHIGDRVRYKGHSCDGIITEITNTDYICGNAKLPISTQDKLELVEQNPVEWKQENIEELTEFENAMMHIGGSFFGENAGLDPNDTATIKEQAELLLELAPKTKWSEEDEKIRKSLLRWLQSNSYTSIAGIQINDVIAWLERTSLRRLCSNNTPNSLLKMMKRTMMLRKKQGQRPQINVTDEELAQARKEAYNEALDKIEYHDEWPTFDDGWNAAIWYLKKRNGRPQSHCKPNDDQTTSRLS